MQDNPQYLFRQSKTGFVFVYVALPNGDGSYTSSLSDAIGKKEYENPSLSGKSFLDAVNSEGYQQIESLQVTDVTAYRCTPIIRSLFDLAFFDIRLKVQLEKKNGLTSELRVTVWTLDKLLGYLLIDFVAEERFPLIGKWWLNSHDLRYWGDNKRLFTSETFKDRDTIARELLLSNCEFIETKK